MKRFSFLFAAVAFAVLSATPVAGQPAAASGPLSRPVSLALLGGVSAGSGDAGASAGGVLTFDASNRVAVETRSVFLQREAGVHGLELTTTALTTIASSERASPYLALGGGLYRASFGFREDRLFGAMSGAGMMSGDTMSTGDPRTPSQAGGGDGSRSMGSFYANRLRQPAFASSGRMMRSFTDPAITVGGGLRFDVNDRVFVRPDVRALVVFSGGDRLVLTTMTVGLGFRF